MPCSPKCSSGCWRSFSAIRSAVSTCRRLSEPSAREPAPWNENCRACSAATRFARTRRQSKTLSSKSWLAGIRGIAKPRCQDVAVTEPLRTALEPHADKIKAAFVFGSVAKGTDAAESDIDLIVIGDALSYADLYTALQNAETALRHKVSPIFLSPAEWRRKASAERLLHQYDEHAAQDFYCRLGRRYPNMSKARAR